MAMNILHLSDLHFGKNHAFEYQGLDPHRYHLGDAVKEALVDAGPLDGIVLSGDLFCTEHVWEHEFVVAQLKHLLQSTNVAPNKVFCVPGNHDIEWDQNPSGRVHYYNSVVLDLGIAGQVPVKGENIDQVHVITAPGNNSKPVALLLLDSCRIEGRAMAGYGLVGDTQLRSLRNEMQRKGISAATHTILAVMHHHLVALWPVYRVYDQGDPAGGKPGRLSLTADAVSVLHWLAECGASGVLHGHQHHPGIIGHRNAMVQRPEIHILAAGSAGASPSAEEQFSRHFFRYEIDEIRLRAWSYNQDRQNPERFKREEKPVTIPLSPRQPAGDDVCRAELVMEINEHAEHREGDRSDLVYLFLNVVDCHGARTNVRSALKIIHDSNIGGQPPNYVRLVGMYDLLGKSDLVIRLRTNLGHEMILSQLLESLKSKFLVLADGPFGEQNSMCCNIKEEGGSLSTLFDGQANSYRRFGFSSSGQYDDYRCQRGFLLIDLPPDHLQQRAMISQLTRVLEAKESSGIIEHVSITDHQLILEMFMRCSQSHLVRQLNRDIEPTLTKFKAQKYTMLCYNYDEAGL